MVAIASDTPRRRLERAHVYSCDCLGDEVPTGRLRMVAVQYAAIGRPPRLFVFFVDTRRPWKSLRGAWRQLRRWRLRRIVTRREALRLVWEVAGRMEAL